MQVVSQSTTDGVPRFLFERIFEDLVDFATANPKPEPVERALRAAVALDGPPTMFPVSSSREAADDTREELANLRAELGESRPAAAYEREDGLLAPMAADAKHPLDPRPPSAAPERAYFAPHHRQKPLPAPLFVDRPSYAWRGGTVLMLMPHEMADPAWKNADLQLMYADRSIFWRDITELTEAQIGRRLAARMKGPPPQELPAFIDRLAFNHTVRLREAAAAMRLHDATAAASWDRVATVDTEGLRSLLASKHPGSAVDSTTCARQLHDDLGLIRDLVHPAPPRAWISPAMDQIRRSMDSVVR